MGVFRLLDLDTEEISSSIVLDQATVVQCDALKFVKWTKKVEEVGYGPVPNTQHCPFEMTKTNTVSEAKIQITLIIVRRGALSCPDGGKFFYCIVSYHTRSL